MARKKIRNISIKKLPEWEESLFNTFDVIITALNYRCFTTKNPLRITLKRGYTAFIGPNNVGKSTILRFIWEIRPILDTFLNTVEFDNSIRTGENSINVSWHDYTVEPEEMFNDRNIQSLEIDIQILPQDGFAFNLHDEVRRIVFNFDRGNLSNVTYKTFGGISSEPMTLSSGRIQRNTGHVVDQGNENTRICSMAAVLTLFHILRECAYFATFRHAEGSTADSDYYDARIGASFIEDWNKLKTGDSKKLNNKARMVENQVKELFGFDSIEIVSSEDMTHLRLMIDDHSCRLDEVGAGIAQVIMLLTGCVINEPSFILVDEPELNLHHYLQMKLLELLQDQAKYGVLFATHNLGLARSCGGRILCVEKQSTVDAPIIHKFEDHPRLAEMFRALSYSGYYGLDAKKILLVEGVTDVNVFRHFLSLYEKEEDYVIINLGGTTLINGKRAFELSELNRIVDEISVIIDSEKSSAEEEISRTRQEFIDICANLGYRNIHILERRATENYFTQNAITKALGKDNFKQLKKFEKLKGQKQKHWLKYFNPMIALEMGIHDLDDTDIAAFLEVL